MAGIEGEARTATAGDDRAVVHGAGSSAREGLPPEPGTAPESGTRPGPPPSWRQAWRIAAHDLGRRLRDRSLLIQGVVAPIGLGLIVGLAFGGGVTGNITIGVADADGSALSRQIEEAVVAGLAANDAEGVADADAVDTEAADEDEPEQPAPDTAEPEPEQPDPGTAEPEPEPGPEQPDPDPQQPGEAEITLGFESVDPARVRRAVEDDTVDAAVVLPEGLGEAMRSGGSVTLEVIGHPGRVLSTSVAESVADGIAGRLAATRLATATTAALADRSGRAVDLTESAGLARELVTPLQAAPRDVRDDFSIIGYFAPAMAMLFLFFTLGTGARSVITERNEGTLARIRAAPVSNGAILVGKSLSVVVLGLLSLATVWAVTAVAFGVDWGDPVGVAAVLAAVVVAIAGIALLVTGLARTENQADAVTTVIALVLAVLGGSFFFGAGGAVAALKPFTPNGQAIMALTELAAGEATLVDVVPTVLLLLATGAVTGAVGLVTLGRKLAS